MFIQTFSKENSLTLYIFKGYINLCSPISGPRRHFIDSYFEIARVKYLFIYVLNLHGKVLYV